MSDNTSALTIVDDAMSSALQLSREAMDASLSPFRRAISQARALTEIRKALTGHQEVTDMLAGLQGSALGFLTDKDKAGGYPANTLVDCAVEAMARGLSLAGNEFNIISGRCYVTKAGMKRLLADYGVKHAVTPGIPKTAGDSVTVPVDIQWEFNGETKSKKLEIPVKMNAGMGAEALQGKAVRKARAWLYELVTGLDIADGDVEGAAPAAPAKKSPIIDTTASAPALAPAREYPALRQALADKGLTYTLDEVTDIINRYGLANIEETYMVQHIDWLIAKLQEGSANV